MRESRRKVACVLFDFLIIGKVPEVKVGGLLSVERPIVCFVSLRITGTNISYSIVTRELFTFRIEKSSEMSDQLEGPAWVSSCYHCPILPFRGQIHSLWMDTSRA